ncbi:DUF3810 domain-containing protein [Kordia algicida OT-1]|uniref:3-deoxy-manno-octulosonate cytidylyltransferase n=1 Tax=Kordia algicida OT-1 TaxID=391587 RepID=A9ECP7_9FLAO|nr:DUF3810 domain-containing protein [Kordia algicida]EDP94398.1 3-deoxy-manno-octulosonate cytidylyltransferase [Kordia algicida OT-1]
MTKRTKVLIALSFPLQFILIKILGNYPEFIETYYSNGLYPYVSKLFRIVFGWIPFSIGDIFYTIAGILIIRYIYKNYRLVRKEYKRILLDIYITITVAYFAFHLLWGMNYYRLPLYKSLELDRKYTTEELVNFTERAIAKANSIQYQITQNDTIKVKVPYKSSEIFEKTMNGYENFSAKQPQFEFSHRSLKTSIYSGFLTTMGFSGYINPFTNEAQINGRIPVYKFPVTASHEKAHQIGYSAENEANFIGCMAAFYNDDIYFQYGAYNFMVWHCLKEVHNRDKDEYERLKLTLNSGIQKNYDEVRAFWTSHKNPLKPMFKFTFDQFLKANNQSGGILSYSYVVSLLVNYDKKHTLVP